jgi:RimJ/RimL family protein N-acetyltransferase
MRQFEENDINDAFKYLSNDDTMYFIEEPFSLEQTIKFITKYGISEEPYIYALVEKHNNKVIGHVIFHSTESDEIYEIGCIIGKEYQHKGYAFEILSSLIAYSFNHLKLHKIMAETIQGNENCIKLLNKLNLKQEGILRKHNWDHGKWVDEYYYGLLREEI